ncbi:MAG: hypothetical protein Q8J78_10280 [Moraxellaceae bacterium]|nr:hypothetical protein [Moraxellaceae bacterium]
MTAPDKPIPETPMAVSAAVSADNFLYDAFISLSPLRLSGCLLF